MSEMIGEDHIELVSHYQFWLSETGSHWRPEEETGWVRGREGGGRAEARSVGSVERSTVTQAKDNGLVQGGRKRLAYSHVSNRKKRGVRTFGRNNLKDEVAINWNVENCDEMLLRGKIKFDFTWIVFEVPVK